MEVNLSQMGLEDFAEFVEFKINSLITRLELDPIQVSWISNDNNIQKALDVHDYEKANRWSVDAIDFGNLAFDAFVNNGDADFTYEVILDEEFVNNDCLKSVYDDMGKAPTFNNYLQNFDGEFSGAHLRFSTSTTLPSTTNATTSAPENYVITITFNVNNLNRPSLSVARTFIHEIIHAEIFRKLLSVAQQPNLQNLTPAITQQIRNDYPGLYDYYIRWKNNIPIGMNLTTAQHQAMAQHYRDIIKQALQEFDNTQTNEVYDALSWIGLKNTIAWNNLTQPEIDSIDQTIINFENNNSNCQ